MISQSSFKEVATELKDHLPLTEWKRLERGEKDADRARRLRIIILGKEGWTAPAIAMAVGLSRRICQRPVRRYDELGLEGLSDLRGRKSSNPLSAEQEVMVRRRIESGPTAEDEVCTLHGKDIQRILAEEFNVCRSLAGVYHLLHRLGYSCLRPRPRHRQADPAKIEAFRQELPERLRAIAAEHPHQRLRVYFQDEARFGQQGATTNVWARRGSRPTAVRQAEYQYYMGAGGRSPRDGTCRRTAQSAAQYVNH